MPKIAKRYEGIKLSLIRQINALATPLTIDLGLGEPNLVPDEEFLEMARSASTTSWRYSANAGSLEVRTVLAASLPTEVDPKTEVCITAGTEEGLYSVMQAFIEAGDEVLVPDPGFLAYPTLVRLADGTPIAYPLDPDGWRILLPELERSITSRTKAIILNTPSNPTGAIVDRPTLERLVEIAEERDILLISDEVYRELYYEAEPPTLLGSSKNVIFLGGLSKSHGMTGLRLGWVVAAEPLMSTIVRAHQYVATCASVFSQDLARRILENREWNARWLVRARAQFGTQRSVMLAHVESLLEVEVPAPGGAFYLFVPVPACRSVDLARALAKEALVLAIPGSAFGAAGEGFLRLSYATDPERIRHGVERIASHLRQGEK